MDIVQLRRAFIDHFASLGYQPHDPASVIPENDPSVLFTTAGMQQFKDFYTSPGSAPNPKLASVQPVIRTSDIGEVGDDTHLTMFEMLGIFSFGQKNAVELKRDAITAMWQFVHERLGVAKDRVHATVFAGDELTPADTQAEQIWHELGVPVKKLGRADNFWGPTGLEGPCGPTSEIFIDDIEVGNLVFNQYFKDAGGKLTELSAMGLDFGSGLERLSATLQEKTSVWQIAPFSGWLQDLGAGELATRRIIIDHLRAIIFLVSAGVVPANKGRDYVLRRLVRKVVFLSRSLESGLDWPGAITAIRDYYATAYSLQRADQILPVVLAEKDLFEKNLLRATHYLDKWLIDNPTTDEKLVTELAFYMYESFGFPKELVIEYLQGIGRHVSMARFEELFVAHQNISRQGMEKQFKGGLADHEPQTIKHHTAHHLLLAALQQVLGKDVVQRGSNVTSERLRLDFNFDRKLTDDELKQVSDIVNQKIAENLPVVRQELPKDEAIASGAQAEFGQKYGDVVTVYSIGDFSKELCGGPHVAETGELGRFEILKEEASSQGIRRIKARVV